MVKKLLKLEWSKFRKNSTITLLFTFFLLFFPMSLYFGSIIDKTSEFIPMKVNILEVPLLWDYLGYAGNWIVFFFLGVIVIYTVAIDVTNKTMRQNIINGLSRKEFYLSKFFNIIVLATIATIYYFILGAVIGYINTEGVSIGKLFDNEWAIPRFWLMSFAYMNFALLLAFLIRKAGIAVFVYLTYILIGEPLVKIWIKKYITDSELVNYLPMNTAEDLMPAPIFKMAEGFTSAGSEYLLDYSQAMVATIVYAFLFIFMAYKYFLAKDI